MSTPDPQEAAATALATLQLRLITHNVRFATDNPSPGERPWSERCPRLCAQLAFNTIGRDASIICLQEALCRQLLDVVDHLNGHNYPDWTHLGVGRDDGQKAGEHSPILYRNSAWVREQQRTYWLSETPDTPSRGWDADLPRIATVARLRHRGSGRAVVVISTHLDNFGQVARRESAKLLLRIAAEWAKGGGGPVRDWDADMDVSGAADGASMYPVFLGGDFNSKPDGAAYQEMTAPGSGMADVSTLLREEEWYGNHDVTYTSFGEPNETPAKIDFLFVRVPGPSAAVRVLTFGVLANRFDDDGVYLSDHRAVVADVEISDESPAVVAARPPRQWLYWQGTR
ncbi:endonuclease/exonuclease/phosphatase [Magnaporthiopsis poae ATCC 64411]|uniref:Endonuclease/exonuclease/phosphatase n=1 Tax=Magnaporthiopsis poae (strain ATCC 64411 / 73-15) TaxID=644358 RepID=A0A0C4EES4_MAGP6|nr:endonuclease/exonuclease/phosphatase [Magnaporthiopsis poae ATCC 64411]